MQDRTEDTTNKMTERGYPTEISIIWSAEDILNEDETLTPEQVRDVLTMLEYDHDPEFGITWETVNECIEKVKSIRGKK